MVNKWIQKAHVKKGALSRQLGIPIEEDIPISILQDIKRKEVGDIVNLPRKGNEVFVRRVKVTKLLKRRAQLALNLKRINR